MVESRKMNKQDVMKLLYFNYSKPKTEDTSSEASFEIDFSYSTIVGEEEEKDEVKKKISNVSFLIDLDKKNHTLYMKRSKLFLKLGQFNEGANDAKSAISIKNDSVDSFILLGKSLSGLNRFGESEMALKRAYELVNGGYENVGVRFKEDQEEFVKRRETYQQKINLIERELRHLRYNTLHSMNFDPILSLKVSTKSRSITEAISMMTHECETILPKDHDGSSTSVWKMGTNIAQRIHFINSSPEETKSMKNQVSSSLGSVGDGSSSKSLSSGSSSYSTPSPSPPIGDTPAQLKNNDSSPWPALASAVKPMSDVQTSENKPSKGKGSWKVVGRKNTSKKPETVLISTPHFDKITIRKSVSPQLDVPKKTSVPMDVATKEDISKMKVINNKFVSMAEVAKELRVLNSQQPSDPAVGKKKSTFVDKVTSASLKNRATNVFKFHGIWVGGISPAVPVTQLLKIFSKYGKVASINHLKENSANCLFVNYFNDVDPINAFMDINGKCVPTISVYPSKLLEVRLAPTDAQMVKYSTMTREKAMKLVHESGECFGWRNSEGCPNFNTCKYVHRKESREIDSRPWIKFMKLKSKLKRV